MADHCSSGCVCSGLTLCHATGTLAMAQTSAQKTYHPETHEEDHYHEAGMSPHSSARFDLIVKSISNSYLSSFFMVLF